MIDKSKLSLRAAWWSLVLLNCIISIALVRVAMKSRSAGILTRDYSYIGDDYPIELPFANELDLVTMTLQETVHYPLNLSDPMMEPEWVTLLTHPVGMGRAHLGPNHRLTTNVFWHQLHCVREMQRAIVQRDHPVATPKHMHHCLNYLRQTFLCDADYTLEKGDFMKRDFDVDRSADTIVCRDWEKGFSLLGEGIRKWAKEKAKASGY